jgi:conjugal transfer mating pair stabilization protein TraN
VSRCWKYEQKHKCVGREANNCSMFEDNRGCTEISGECLEQTDLGICKHFEKKFICGVKLEEKAESRLINTEFNVIKDEKDLSGCSNNEIDKYCSIASEVCVEGPETRNIGGKSVTKNCWKWERKYTCRTDTYIDECKELKEKCTEVSRICLHSDADRCEHFEVKY